MIKFEKLFEIHADWHTYTEIHVFSSETKVFNTSARECVLFNPDIIFMNKIDMIWVEEDTWTKFYRFCKRRGTLINVNNDVY